MTKYDLQEMKYSENNTKITVHDNNNNTFEFKDDKEKQKKIILLYLTKTY